MKNLILALTLFSSASGFAAQVQPVPIPEDAAFSPQVEISGTGIATLGVRKTANTPDATSKLNFEDSSLFVGASERLYGDGIGSFGIGGVTTDDQSQNGRALYLNRAFVDYQSQTLEFFLGRSDISNSHLIDFPTLRDDDLLSFTNPLNPLSNGAHAEDHRYSYSASVTLNQGLSHFESLHVQHLVSDGSANTNPGLNSFGASYEYLAPPGLEKFQRVSSVAVGYDRTLIQSSTSSGMNQFTGGMVLNVNESATDLIDLRFQAAVELGSELTQFQTVNDSFQANAHQLALALRYLHEPFGMAGYQLALTLAHKNYFKVNEAGSYAGALTGVKQLGHGFDLVAQYQGVKRDAALAAVQSAGQSYEQIFEVGLVFNFSLTLNPHLSPRRTLLNQQHLYLPQ